MQSGMVRNPGLMMQGMLETRHIAVNGDDRLFLPNFCDVRMVFAVVVIVELLAFVTVLLSDGMIPDRWSYLGLVSLFLQWVGLTCAAVLCVSRKLLTKLGNTAAAIVSYLLLLLVTASLSEAAFWLISRYPALVALDSLQHDEFLLHNLAVSAIISAVALRYLYVQHQWRVQIQAEAHARLQALQARIRPHFLFNSMNTIASLTRSEPDVAEEAVQELADLFRATLTDDDNRVKLSDELELAHRYLHMESLRLGDRLRVEWNLCDLPMDAYVPPLILQPLLENAVYHGIERLPQGGTIQVSGRYSRNRMSLQISNPVTGNGVNRSRSGNRIALENIMQRLILAYGSRSRLISKIREGSYQVELLFPLETAL